MKANKNLKSIYKEMLKTFQKPRKLNMYYDVVKNKIVKLKSTQTKE